MSRERPAEPPRAVPDGQRGVKSHIERRKERQQAELERVKAFSGPGFFGGFSALMTRGGRHAPRKRAP